MAHVRIGPPPFKLQPEVLAEIRHQAEVYRNHHDGLLPNTVPWRYLEDRWALDHARFDRWHPLIGRWITENYNLTHERNIPIAPHNIPYDPVVPVVVVPTQPQVVAVPEPSSELLVCVGLFILVVVAHVVDGRRKS